MKNNIRFMIMSHPNVSRNTHHHSIVYTDTQCIYFTNLLYLMKVLNGKMKNMKNNISVKHTFTKNKTLIFIRMSNFFLFFFLFFSVLVTLN